MRRLLRQRGIQYPGRLAITLRGGLALRPQSAGLDRRPLQGAPEEIVSDLRRYRKLGIGTVLLESRYRDLDDTVRIFETFARDVRPRLAD